MRFESTQKKEGERLAKADRSAQEQYPIGSLVRIKENRHWGKVVGYVTETTYGMKKRQSRMSLWAIIIILRQREITRLVLLNHGQVQKNNMNSKSRGGKLYE